MVPFKQMSEEVFWLRMVLGIFILVMIVFTVVLTLMLMLYFGRPINQLKHCMMQVTKGNFQSIWIIRGTMRLRCWPKVQYDGGGSEDIYEGSGLSAAAFAKR